MRPTLRRKLTLSFLLISMISFLMIGALANLILERQFKRYVIDKLDQQKQDVVDMLENQVTGATGSWDVRSIENIGVSALGDGLITRVIGADGTELWDAMAHNQGFCADMLQQMAGNMQKQYGSFQGGYTESAYPLTADGALVGMVTVGYYGPYFYSDNDLLFLNTLNMLLLLATGITAVLSVVVGTFTAKRLTGPISRVIKTAEQISLGNYNGRIHEAANTREIVALTESINTLADSLGKQEALRRRLTADVAHELRTPIANLQGHLEAMIDGVWQADTERLVSCHEETVRLTGIVKDLETLARYDSEKPRLDLEELDISACLSKTLKTFDSEFARKNITLNPRLPELTVRADRDKLARIFTNIISNALKYTPEGGRVEVTVTGDDTSATVSVSDTGIGISTEDLPYIFERFYRADMSRSRETGGAGIGLAIVKSLVVAHGGTVTANSEYGKGSTFLITLPR
jgi:signal transduction histidine kinase